ncbi:MAG: VWA domain-containing protein [Alphaproteobacteria bacterium HGW-Alphaproteobacteria-2]|nr:MAG: VWA domain-containing protein [Alphaproteobacteria bacterium HGW-Alphaproteobacteria-2]
MFVPFFEALRAERVPVTLREYLAFLEGMARGLVIYDIEEFYYFARTAMVKDERHLDRFDRAFSAAFKGLEDLAAEDVLAALDLPADWLRKLAEKHLTEEEKAQIEALGGFDKLMETLKKRLEEQQGRHQGGNKWIGTAGTSPFGAYGYNPEGVRIGQNESRQRRAVKVLDVKTRPERHNAVKVLLFLDIGGSMDDHVKLVEELFSAARSEFKHLEYWYFHNCLYEGVWRDNRRRWDAVTPTHEVLNTYAPDYKCLFVGDASMSPYEITFPGGASEHWNAEAGQVWLERARAQWPSAVWINPVPEQYWRYTQSIGMISAIFEGRMFPMTLSGIEAAVKAAGR